MMDKHDAVIFLVQWLIYIGGALVVIVGGMALTEWISNRKSKGQQPQ